LGAIVHGAGSPDQAEISISIYNTSIYVGCHNNWTGGSIYMPPKLRVIYKKIYT